MPKQPVGRFKAIWPNDYEKRWVKKKRKEKSEEEMKR